MAMEKAHPRSRAAFLYCLSGLLGLILPGCQSSDPKPDPSLQEPDPSKVPNPVSPLPSTSSSVDPTQSGSEPEGLPDSNLPDGNNDDCECAENSDLIYLLSSDHSLWRFNPKDKKFEDLGGLDCKASPLDTPFSLGVDRHSKAWVQMQPSGKVYVANTLAENNCVDSGFKPGDFEYHSFGMAFMDKPSDASCEQLYMHSFDGLIWSEGEDIGAMGHLDPESMNTRTIGRIDFNGGELSGTRDGRLFAFAGEPAKLIEYDADTAEAKKITDLGGLSLTLAFAFAFWGGDFYFFTQAEGTLPITSKVTKLDYDGDGSLTTFVENAPIQVVGAGVSVCAPVTPPV